MRVLCHAQSLSGVGHFVRMLAIARGLAEAHEVHFVRGSRTVERPPHPGRVHWVDLPPVVRVGGELRADGDGSDLATVLGRRSEELARAVGAIRPDILLIEHFPFSKWDFASEIHAAIDAARASNRGVRVVCSVRDIVRRTQFEAVDRVAYEERVAAELASRFDALLVHADPAFVHLREHFSTADHLTTPVHHTGFVVDPAPPVRLGACSSEALLSCGGGGWNSSFLAAGIWAFRRLSTAGVLGSMRLRVHPGTHMEEDALAALHELARGGPIDIGRFGPDFEARLATCPLTISRAGYNTTAAVLRARARAVLVPDPAMADQPVRAARMGALGLAVPLPAEAQDAASLADAMRRGLAMPPPEHRLDLGGVARTRAILEQLAGA